MLLNNKCNECKNVLVLFLTFIMLVSAKAQTLQPCVDKTTQYIIGGGIADDKAQTHKESKCFTSVDDDNVKYKATKSLKLDKTVKLDRNINQVALKVNLYDKKMVEDRNYILNTELRKATMLKDELLKKKSSGLSVDELQLSRIDADIAALKNELSRQ